MDDLAQGKRSKAERVYNNNEQTHNAYEKREAANYTDTGSSQYDQQTPEATTSDGSEEKYCQEIVRDEWQP